jgi:hypothetical protein
LLERVTDAPPVGAEPLRVTVPVAVPAPVSTLGLKARELTTTEVGFTVSVAVTACGEFEAPVAVTVIVAVYVPGLSPAGLTDTLSVDGAVPEVWPSTTQGWDVVADHVSVPPPELPIARFRGGGVPPPWVAVKDRPDGEI